MREPWRPLALSLLLASCGGAPSGSSHETDAAPAGGPPVVVKVSYGSEKKAFLEDAIAAFEASGAAEGGRPIRIDAVAEGSAESMEAILAGRSTPTVWSPASSFLVDVLNDRWREQKAGLGGGSPLVAEAPPLLLSPVVIALWEPMARALGWPDKAIGWSDLAALGDRPEGWSAHGHPEWGSFKLGHTHPLYSNSGALALVAATYAGAGKTRDLGLEDVAKAQPFVRRVQGSIVHYGRSTGFFAEKMFTRGPAYLSAAVLYENLVAEGNLDPRYASKPFPVVAVYPREGTFWADHPWAILDLPSTTAEQRSAARKFGQFLLSAERQRVALTRFGFRPADPQVPLGAPLDRAHGLDPQQPKNVLPNPEVAVTRRILAGFDEVKRPVALGLVIDVSGSMSGEPLQQARAGARGFLESLPAHDLARLLVFSTRPTWVVPDYLPLGTSRARLSQPVDALFAGGDTALYDAILAALRAPDHAPRGAIRALVVLSDGQDNKSRAGLEEVLAAVRKGEGEDTTAVRVFTIAYGPKADADVLKRIAEAGGGAFFSGTPKDIQAVYADLATFF